MTTYNESVTFSTTPDFSGDVSHDNELTFKSTPSISFEEEFIPIADFSKPNMVQRLADSLLFIRTNQLSFKNSNLAPILVRDSLIAGLDSRDLVLEDIDGGFTFIIDKVGLTQDDEAWPSYASVDRTPLQLPKGVLGFFFRESALSKATIAKVNRSPEPRWNQMRRMRWTDVDASGTNVLGYTYASVGVGGAFLVINKTLYALLSTPGSLIEEYVGIVSANSGPVFNATLFRKDRISRICFQIYTQTLNADIRILVGIGTGIPAPLGASNNGIYQGAAFRYSGNVDVGNWATLTNNGSSIYTTLDVHPIAANKSYTLEIINWGDSVANGKVEFLINGKLVATHTGVAQEALSGGSNKLGWFMCLETFTEQVATLGTTQIVTAWTQ